MNAVVFHYLPPCKRSDSGRFCSLVPNKWFPKDTELENSPTLVLVVAALIRDSLGRVLLQQRPEGKAHAGLWEFPGGKVEPNENPRESLVREIEEELGLALYPSAMAPVGFADIAPDYGESGIVILLYNATVWSGEPEAREGGDLRWVPPSDLGNFPMPPLDVKLVRQIGP